MLGLVGLAIIAGLVLWKVPQWQVPSGVTDPKDRAELEDQFRGTIAQIVLGVVVLAGAYFTWRQVTAGWRTVEISQEQQITERFTRAIEQLGSDKLPMKLGGIYALERIAKDSPKDHWQVMEVLTAYVRENAKWEGDCDPNGVPITNDPVAHQPATDIQAIVTVLGRRNDDMEQEDQRLDLQGTDLRGANLVEANLKKVVLAFANLQDASFLDANLQDAFLAYVNLQNAFFYDADLQGADLQGADLESANFSDSKGLTQEQIDSAIIDEHTILPDYLKGG